MVSCLAGIDGDLYYVRDGAINQYALSFDMPLKDEVNDLYFTWHSKSVVSGKAGHVYTSPITHRGQCAVVQEMI